MSSSSEIHIRDTSDSSGSSPTPRVKAVPTISGVVFSYSLSDDGTDENLLILLHGLGDSHFPFLRLGRQLKLPQTATLSLRAPEQVPFLYKPAYQWYTSFTPLGELVTQPDPTPALQYLLKLIDHLVEDCGWPSDKIHFLGFAQGGSVAAEFGMTWWKRQLELMRQDPTRRSTALGSIITIAGPLLSHPTVSTLNPTPILVVHRPPPAESALPKTALTAFKKAYSSVTEVTMHGKKDGMPSSKEEWEPIMRFWSEKLARRKVEGLYEVMSGGLATTV